MAIAARARDLAEARVAMLRAAERPVIDGDTHPTDIAALDPDLAARRAASPNYYHGRAISPDELIAELDGAGVQMALSWQNPAATVYSGDPQGDFDALRRANDAVFAAAERWPDRILPAGWTDPKALGVDGAQRMIDHCADTLGAAVVKLNPAQNAFPIDSDPVLACVDHIVARGLVPAFHYGADTPYTPPAGFAAIAARHPDRPVIGVHMGGGGASYVEGEDHAHASRSLLREHPNVFFIQSAKRDTHIESDFIDAAGEEAIWRRIAVGSDAPYGRVSWNFGGYRAMFASLTDGERHTDPRLRERPDLIDETKVAGFMGANLRDLLADAWDRALTENS